MNLRSRISIIPLILLCLSSGFLSAQAPDLVWVRQYGGSSWESNYNLLPLHNGGMFFCGSSLSDDFDLSTHSQPGGTWLVKTDSNGQIIWDRLTSEPPYGSAVFKTAESPNGCIYITGSAIPTDSLSLPNPKSDMALAKYDSMGNILWVKYYGGPGNDIHGQVSISPEGRIYIGLAAYTPNTQNNQDPGILNVRIMEIDSSGTILWNTRIEGAQDEQFLDMHYAPDGGVYCFVQTLSDSIEGLAKPGGLTPFYSHSLLFKLGNTGQLEWGTYMDENFYGSTPSSIHLLENGNILAVAKPYANEGCISVMKLTHSGKKLWYRVFGVRGEIWIEKTEVTREGGYLLIGRSNISNPKQSAHVIKLDSNGQQTWSKEIGGNQVDVAYSGFQTASGEILISGYTNSTSGDIHSLYGNNDIFIAKIGVEPFQISGPRVACAGDSLLFLSNATDSLNWFFQGNEVAKGHYYYHQSSSGQNNLTVRACISDFGMQRCDTHFVSLVSMPEFKLEDSVFSCIGTDAPVCLNHLSGVTAIKWDNGSTDSCIDLVTPGIHRVSLSNEGCTAQDSVRFSHYPYSPYQVLQTDTPCIREEPASFQLFSPVTMICDWNQGISHTDRYAHNSEEPFTLRLEDPYGCTSDTLIAPLSRCAFSCFIPTSFSPNNDGINDTFAPQVEEANGYYMEIYSTWGECVFKGNNLPWNGFYQGLAVPAGVYLVIVKVEPTDLNEHKPVNYRGVLTLLR